MNIRKFFMLFVLLLFLASIMTASNAYPAPVYAQTNYASIAMYVRCASGALPAIGTYQGTWQNVNFQQYLHDLPYNGVVNGYRAYSYTMAVAAGSWRTKVTSTGGYDTGWSGWKSVSGGGAISWTYYRTVSC